MVSSSVNRHSSRRDGESGGAIGKKAGRSRSPGPTRLRSPLLLVCSYFSAYDCFSLSSSSFLLPGFSQPLQLTAFPSRAMELVCAFNKPTTDSFCCSSGAKVLLAALSGRIKLLFLSIIYRSWMTLHAWPGSGPVQGLPSPALYHKCCSPREDSSDTPGVQNSAHE